MKIAITGANGQLGRLIIAHLKTLTGSENLIALVRTPSKASDLGLETRAFDYSKVEGQADALKGVDTLMLVSGSEIGKRKEQHENVINAAKTAGVKRIVYTSLLRADSSSLSLAPEHLATEAALKASGLAYTILRNGWYTENYTASVPAAVKGGAFIGAAGDGKISSAARTDYAEAAAIALTSEGQEGKVYELSGDSDYTLKDLAAEISSQTGKNIPYINMTEAEYAKALEGAGLPAPLAAAFASFDTGASKGDLYDEGHVLSEYIGHPTTSLKELVKAALA